MMNRHLAWVLITLSLGLFVAAQPVLEREAAACTSFALKQGKQLVVAKSYDWRTADGLLVVNPRGLAKQALIEPMGRSGAKLSAARWVARYGSVTFNQYGRELPLGGINERGLVVEIMWLSAARYGKPVAGRPTVNELQWIQYLLDNAATIDEAIAAARKLQVAKVYAAVHYLACDAKGRCATFDHLGGKLQVHHGGKLKVAALTNDSYARSLGYLRQHEGFGGAREPRPGTASLDRFVRVAVAGRRPAKAPLVRRAFKLLEAVQIGTYTKWQIVYQPRQRKLSFRQRGQAKPIELDLRRLSFDCRGAVRIMDLKGTVLGGRGRWASYSTAHNHKLLEISLGDLELPLPPQAVGQLAAYPAQATRCVAPAQREKVGR